MLVGRHHDRLALPAGHRHRHDLGREVPRGHRGGAAALALEGEGVLGFATHAELPGHHLGRLAETDRPLVGERRIREPPSEG